MNIKLFPFFFLSITKIAATIILVPVFLGTYTREFYLDYIPTIVILPGTLSLLIIAILISRVMEPVCMLSTMYEHLVFLHILVNMRYC